MRIGIDAASIVGDKGGRVAHHHLLKALLELDDAGWTSGIFGPDHCGGHARRLAIMLTIASSGWRRPGGPWAGVVGGIVWICITGPI